MVEILYGLFPVIGSEEGFPGEIVNSYGGAGYLRKSSRSFLQHPGKCFPGKILDVIKTATGTAGNRTADLAQIDFPRCSAIKVNQV